jgi:hypothetical protein
LTLASRAFILIAIWLVSSSSTSIPLTNLICSPWLKHHYWQRYFFFLHINKKKKKKKSSVVFVSSTLCEWIMN